MALRSSFLIVALVVSIGCGAERPGPRADAVASQPSQSLDRNVCMAFMAMGVFYLQLGRSEPDSVRPAFTGDLDPEAIEIVRRSGLVDRARVTTCRDKAGQPFAEVRLFFDRSRKFVGSYITAWSVDCARLTRTAEAFDADRRYETQEFRRRKDGIAARFSGRESGRRVFVSCDLGGRSIVIFSNDRVFAHLKGGGLGTSRD